jgi:hypothetical protein
MNNVTTGNAPRHPGERTDVLAMQILGLIAREGNGQFTPTDKALRLKLALTKKVNNEALTDKEQALVDECAGAIA